MPNPDNDRLIESVRYFRALGFFSEHSALPDYQLTARLQELAKARHGGIEPSDELADLILLSLDEQRVWWDDTEADVCAENLVYKQTLRQWAEISRGAFAPENIRESWEADEGPVEVAFQHKGHFKVLHPRYQDDYIDINILDPINKLISSSGIQFAVHAIFDQTVFVVALTTSEKDKLQKERGWRFAI